MYRNIFAALAGLAVAGAVAGSAMAVESWTSMGRHGDMEVYHQPPTQQGAYRHVWLRYEYDELQQPFGYLSSNEQLEVDCSQSRVRARQLTVYREHELRGESFDAGSGPGEWTVASPGTLNEAIARIACSPSGSPI